MGGPMGVGDQGEVEWLASEIEYIRDLVENDVPVWGVCLGSHCSPRRWVLASTRALCPKSELRRSP
nr:hypothetical protein [Rhodococcus erythropolis]